jgi:galactoside O-acetyltransferase
MELTILKKEHFTELAKRINLLDVGSNGILMNWKNYLYENISNRSIPLEKIDKWIQYAYINEFSLYQYEWNWVEKTIKLIQEYILSGDLTINDKVQQIQKRLYEANIGFSKCGISKTDIPVFGDNLNEDVTFQNRGGEIQQFRSVFQESQKTIFLLNGFKSVGKNVRISSLACFYNPAGISVGEHVRIDDFCILSGNIDIGCFVHIAPYCGLYGNYGIVMKDFSGLSSRVSIYSGSDDYRGDYLTNPTVPDKYKDIKSGEVILEKHVIIGAGSVILPNVRISEGTAVGSLSLVLKDLEPWKIYAGIPCRQIKDRSKGLLDLEKALNSELRNQV